ncbi:MAG: hypothetical protein ABW046_02720, partial [Actinoplanes sp.]
YGSSPPALPAGASGGSPVYGSAPSAPPSSPAAAPGVYGSTTPPGVYGSAAPPGGPSGAAAPADAPEPKKRRGRLVAVLVSLLLLLGLVGAGAGFQLKRELPAATLTTSVASTLTVPGKATALPWPKVGSAELMIEGLGRLGGKGKSAAQPIGSVAKVMTAYVILKEHPLEGDEEGPSITVTAADVADYQRRIPLGQSQVPIAVGTKLTERDALEALMLPSANNVAHMLSIWDAGSEAAFLTKMNDAADELGMTDTKYTDPSGYLPSTISTAPDQVILGRAAIKMPVFAEIVAMTGSTIPVAGKIKNYNDLLGVEGVFGIKTGSTDEAGGNLLFASRLTVGTRTLILVGAVFNQPGANTPQQLAEVNRVVKKLLVAVRKSVKEYEVLAAAPVGEVRTAWDATSAVRPAAALKVIGWPGLKVPVKVTTTAPGAQVTAGQPVGSVEARVGDSPVLVDLVAETATPEPDLWWRLSRRP